MIDTNQFEVFMRNYQDMVYSIARRLLANAADAEDVAQTAFMKAYENFESISQSPTAGGWLKTVTTNLCLNHLSRYRSRWRFFSEFKSNEEEPDFLEGVAGEDTFEQDVATGDYRQLIEKAISKLPPAQRVPLVLFHFEDLPYEEIAQRLNVSLSKVKTDIHRARLALKRFLAPGLSGEDRWENQPAERPRKSPPGSEPRASARSPLPLPALDFFNLNRLAHGA